MLEDGGRHLGDAGRRGRVDADGEERDERVAGDERAVAAAAEVVAASEVGELPPLRGRDEQLAGVRVRERGAHALGRIGMLELGRGEVLAAAPRDRGAVLVAKRDLDRRLRVETPPSSRGSRR